MANSAGRINKGALGGGLALIGVGAGAVVAGLAVCVFVAASAARDRFVEWQQDPSTLPPSELALHHLKRAAAAGGASVTAWRNGGV